MLAIIFGMFAVTFGIRFVLFARAHRISLPVWVENALGFVPVAVLSAIILPMILMPHGQFSLDWKNPWLLGALAAFITGMRKQKPMLTILVGVVVFFLSQWWLSQA